MQGLIFSIKRYSVHDGPGIRITFFMKGCPLSCWWCHNPEGLNPSPERVILTRKVGEKEFREEEEVGRYYSVEDILEIIEKDAIFIRQSNGGVTFSGGEPVMQAEFLAEALEACKEKGYHTAVDTSGYSQRENYMKIIRWTDLFLFDLKHLDNSKHLEYTGVPNAMVLQNLQMLLKHGKDVMVRIPVIPGKNDDPAHLAELKEYLASLGSDNLRRINLLPFHRIGASKYKRFNLPYRMGDTVQPSSARMKELKEYFEGTGIKVKIGG